MWWLDDGPRIEIRPESDSLASHAQDVRDQLLRAFQPTADEPASQQASRFAAMRRQVRRLKQAVKSAKATIVERDAANAEQIAELKQSREHSEAAFQERDSRRAAEMDSLRMEMESLRESLEKQVAACSDLEAASAARDLSHAAELVAFAQAQHDAETAVLESESRRASAIEKWESALQDLGQTVAKYEAARGDLQIAFTQRDEQLARSELAREKAIARIEELSARLTSREAEAATLHSSLETESTSREAAERELDRCREEHAAELAHSSVARQEAERLCAELDTQRQSLQRLLEAAAAQAGCEAESRAAAECELQRMRDDSRQLHSQAEQARGEYQELQRQSAEQRDRLATEVARLRRDVDDCERELRDRDEQMRRLTSELNLSRERERAVQIEKQQLAEQHAAQTASLESEAAGLRLQVEAELATRIRVELEIQQVAEELTRQLSEERQRSSSSQRQLTELQVELERQQRELDNSHAEAAAAIESQRAAQRQIDEYIDAHQTFQRELDEALTSAAATDARRTSEVTEVRTALAANAAELSASQGQIRQLRHNLREAIECCQIERDCRQRAEAFNEPLTQEVDLLRKRADAFRGLAQREIAARRKLEAAIKQTGDATGASTLAIRTNIEFNERIRRLTTELTAVRNQELSVRQRATQEIKRALAEVQQLKDQLARERNAA